MNDANLPPRSVHRNLVGFVLASMMLCAPAFAQSNPKKDPERTKDAQAKVERAKRLELMRNLAQSVSIARLGEGDAIEVERIAEPLYRFNDPARGRSDGTIWAWGRIGRPAALLVMENDGRGRGYVGETVSLSDHRIKRTDDNGPGWTSRGPGVDMRPIPGVAAASKTAMQRQRELRRLARRFTAYEEWDDLGRTKLQRYTLRLLTQPIHRYSDPKQGLEEGGLFLFSYGGNPEIVMVLEARRDEKGTSHWHCGFNRTSWAALHVLFDGKQEVWKQPMIRGATDTYLLRRFAPAE